MHAPPLPARRPSPAAGLALAAPAFLLWIVTLVIPSGQTLVKSFQHITPFELSGVGGGSGPHRWAGFGNYSDVLASGRFWQGVTLAVVCAVLPVLVAVAVAPLLAAGLDAGGPFVRRAGRVLLSVPLVLFSPIATALTFHHRDLPGGGWSPAPPRGLAGYAWLVGAGSFGVVAGLAVLAYLAVFAARADRRRTVLGLVVVGAVGALAAAAMAVQSYTLSIALHSPTRANRPLAWEQFATLAQFLDAGHAAVYATVIGVVAGVLGTAATVLLVATRTRILLGPAGGGPRRPVVPLGVVVAVVLAVVLLASLWPRLSVLGHGGGRDGSPSAASYTRTWLPALFGGLVPAAVSFAAALGISGFRPLGRHSEWLLLPFSPWLFAGTGPLSVADWQNARDLHLINTLPGLVQPVLVSVPALVVFSLYFRGQSGLARRSGTGLGRAVLLPALPLGGLVAGALVLAAAQDLTWPYLIWAKGGAPVPVATVLSANAYPVAAPPVGDLTPWPVVIVALAALVAAQFRYLDRLVLRPGTAVEDDPQPS